LVASVFQPGKEVVAITAIWLKPNRFDGALHHDLTSLGAFVDHDLQKAVS
jgi:hypothetical protein